MKYSRRLPGAIRKIRKDCGKRSCKCNWKTLPFSYQGYFYVQILGVGLDDL